VLNVAFAVFRFRVGVGHVRHSALEPFPELPPSLSSAPQLSNPRKHTAASSQWRRRPHWHGAPRSERVFWIWGAQTWKSDESDRVSSFLTGIHWGIVALCLRGVYVLANDCGCSSAAVYAV